ncbi:MAG: hypothetical protein RBR48_00710 [Bacilli bacterium]|jgi:inhibitor of KinA sporulation pathway (predicted exonuclease)|nr:hypothetical protein [Bacilli bacterium]MDD3348672.1 hypothetical protein [Bacilli bacterium]MDD4056178.1 hypothetical protein [Bacilli bacterium]MDY0208686.1 hypothetical protein [Bacilli bacterium]
MKIYGKVLKVFPQERVLKIEYDNRLFCLYMTRKTFKDFGPYFYKKPYIFVEIKPELKKYGQYYGYEISNFIKVVEPRFREKRIYYDIETIKKDIKKLINKTRNRLFIDLEFSLPAYYQSMPHVAEIVQYGIIVENNEGKVIFQDSNLVKPLRKYGLNSRTLTFISRKREEFDHAIEYIDFYKLLESCLKKYNSKIIAWGKSDILTLEQSFILNKIKPLNLRKNHINLMQVIKNYYNQKEDLGLFNTYQEYADLILDEQTHDALEDARITREIYKLFKEKINKEK